MSKDTITVHTCDRCKKTTQVKTNSGDGHLVYDWGSFFYVNNNGPIYSGHVMTFPKTWDDMRDLCGSCMKELDDWFRGNH